MKKFTRAKRGFTLVEVTLAIVIGIILIAGATLIYNQAKNSAGNSRANAKVVALQSVVEEFAAMNGGLYPDKIAYVQGMWSRRRPDDFNKSPWGGLVGSQFNAANMNGVMTVGADGISLDGDGLTVNGPGDAGPFNLTFPATGVAEVNTADPTRAGGLVYSYNQSLTLTYAKDLRTNNSVTVRAMSIFICDQQGKYPNFIVGGRLQ